MRNCNWIEKHCFIPDGKDAGKPVRLRPWQRTEICKIYDNPHGTRQAIISFPRKNGKTALIAFLLLLHLCGPEHRINSQLYSAAQSKDQAATVFKLAAKTVRMSPTLSPVIVIRDTIKELACPQLGTIYAALSAEKSTAHGKSPVFAVHDELGQVKGPASELYDAVETGMGAHESPLSIIISTQAPTDNDLLSRLIDHGLSGNDPQTVVSLYTAPMDADPFSLETLQKCNPAWGDFLNAEEVLRTMRAAMSLPSQEPSYRNLHLNQRVEASSPFISRSLWQSCAGEIADDWSGLDVYAGLDLSSTKDLTALVRVANIGGKWQVKPTFWLPSDGLVEKSKADRVPYDVWAKEGSLETTPGASIEYEYVATYLAKLHQKEPFKRVAFDAWGYKYLKPWLQKAGFPDEMLEGDDAIFKEFRQGTASMTPAMRTTETLLLNSNVVHDNHPVLTMCMANAVVHGTDDNRKLDKMKSTGRIDGAVALVMAIAVGAEEYKAVEAGSYLDTMSMVVL